MTISVAESNPDRWVFRQQTLSIQARVNKTPIKTLASASSSFDQGNPQQCCTKPFYSFVLTVEGRQVTRQPEIHNVGRVSGVEPVPMGPSLCSYCLTKLVDTSYCLTKLVGTSYCLTKLVDTSYCLTKLVGTSYCRVTISVIQTTRLLWFHKLFAEALWLHKLFRNGDCKCILLDRLQHVYGISGTALSWFLLIWQMEYSQSSSMTTSHKSQAFPTMCHRVLCWAHFSSSSTQNLNLTWFSVTRLNLNLSRTILSSKSLSLHQTFNLQYLLWKSVCQTFRPGCWKTNLNLTMIKQRPSSCAYLSPFQSANLLPSLSVAVKYLFLLLPEILVFTSEITWV